ncbi:MAG: putative DNA-binding protein [Limnochordia bacterium]|jgi:predicted DNA-binding protein YlxM (UPF0122 family)|nr:putative DNA-binding protein [Limnochordia bacterium]
MENALRMALLFDFYGPLLTERQQDVYQMYFHEDLSLGEIGEELHVSRQAIYDIIKRSGSILEDFDSKLGLVEKHHERQLLYGEVLELIQLCREATPGDRSLHLSMIKEKIKRAQGQS